MIIRTLFPSKFASNCYLLISGNDAFVVDPGQDADIIKNFIDKFGVNVKAILLTHGHFDHIMSAEDIRQTYGADIMIHSDDGDMPGDAEKNAYLSFYGSPMTFAKPDFLLGDGDVLTLGNEKIRVMHTPGHTPGSVCYITDTFIVSGDTLFAEGFGRVDLPGGSFHSMKNSLLKLNTLDTSLTIYPGHGESSTLGDALSRYAFLKSKKQENN